MLDGRVVPTKQVSECSNVWPTVRLQYLVSQPRSGSRGATDYIGLEHVESGTGKLLDTAKFEDMSGDGLEARPGDVLFGKLRPYLAKAWQVDLLVACSSEFAVLRPGPKIDTIFLKYLLVDSRFVDRMTALTYGAQMPRIAANDIGDYAFRLPPLPTQRAIATFLDRETARIDSLIEKKRRLLDLLDEKRTALITRAVTRGLDPDVPMKDSGVEWLGEVPEHWEVLPVYARFHVVLGKMLDSKTISGDNLRPYLRNQDVQWRSVNTSGLPVMSFSAADRARYALAPDDLLICEGGDVGRSAIWHQQIEECYYQKALHRVRPRGECSASFLFFVMWTASSLGVFEAGSNPNTILHLTAEMLRHHRIPSPPTSEQISIGEYLDAAWAETERLRKVITHAISLLDEYRTALISAAVTGQIDVPSEAA